MERDPQAGMAPVSELMETRVVFVSPDDTVEAAADHLSNGEIGVVVVGHRPRPEAVFSERDLVRAVAARRVLAKTPVGEVASHNLVFCDATAPVVEVAEEMMERYVRHVLVERNGHLVGIVSMRDLLGAYAAADMSVEEPDQDRLSPDGPGSSAPTMDR